MSIRDRLKHFKKPEAAKPKAKRGRPPLGDKPMTNAEHQRRYRARKALERKAFD